MVVVIAAVHIPLCPADRPCSFIFPPDNEQNYKKCVFIIPFFLWMPWQIAHPFCLINLAKVFTHLQTESFPTLAGMCACEAAHQLLRWIFLLFLWLSTRRMHQHNYSHRHNHQNHHRNPLPRRSHWVTFLNRWDVSYSCRLPPHLPLYLFHFIPRKDSIPIKTLGLC